MGLNIMNYSVLWSGGELRSVEVAIINLASVAKKLPVRTLHKLLSGSIRRIPNLRNFSKLVLVIKINLRLSFFTSSFYIKNKCKMRSNSVQGIKYVSTYVYAHVTHIVLNPMCVIVSVNIWVYIRIDHVTRTASNKACSQVISTIIWVK